MRFTVLEQHLHDFVQISSELVEALRLWALPQEGSRAIVFDLGERVLKELDDHHRSGRCR
jgi:hypothetical protein